MRSGHSSDETTDPVDAAAFGCGRFWLPRGTAPDLSDDGFLFNPESVPLVFAPEFGFPFQALAHFPVLALLGEPGMGKSTVLKQEVRRLEAATQENADRFLRVDLAACGTDVLVCQKVFESRTLKSWRKSKARLHLFLDGFDTCMQHVETLVALLLERFEQEPRDRLSLRIACRTTEWPADLEEGLRRLWHQQAIDIYELAALRRDDVRKIAKAALVSGEDFLAEVDRVGAAQFANRPITLRFLLNSFRTGKGLPKQRNDLYREGCLILCDEWRDDLRRSMRSQRFSSGLRFAVASRFAAVSVFSRRTAIWTAARRDAMPGGDVRIDELRGDPERFEREITEVTPEVARETIATGLFQSLGPGRLGFSHQTYAEFLAAQYLVDHRVPVPKMLDLILDADGSGKVVPQLRETAAWLAAMVPEVRAAILSTDAEALFVSDTPPTSELDRRDLVRQILRLYDSSELYDEHIVWRVGSRQDGARLNYPELAEDLRPYLRDKSRGIIVRRVAILLAELTRQTMLRQELVETALDEEDDHDLRVMAGEAVEKIGDDAAKAALRALLKGNLDDDEDDGLRGRALAATWPSHLTAQELFTALTPPKQSHFTSPYHRFLRSDFTGRLQPEDMCVALDWARMHATDRYVEVDSLAAAALRVIAAAIDCFDQPGVPERLAEILLMRAPLFVHHQLLSERLHANKPARLAISSIAIRKAPDCATARLLLHTGLIEIEDVLFLLSELEEQSSSDVQERIAALIADLLFWALEKQTELFDTVFTSAQGNPILANALRPFMNAVGLGSPEAERQRLDYQVQNQQQDEKAAAASPPPQIHDLIATFDNKDHTIFGKICFRLGGRSPRWDCPDGDVPPGWQSLEPEQQALLLTAAQSYLDGFRVANLVWLRSGEFRSCVGYGWWALLLLSMKAPTVFDSLSDDVWKRWMLSAFGYPAPNSLTDEKHARVIKTAYRRSPKQFLKVLDLLIKVQNKNWGDVFILDRVTPIWDEKVADLLRSWLEDRVTLKPRAFRRLLNCLIKAGDSAARNLATDIVRQVTPTTTADLDKPVMAAFELLEHDPPAAWDLVWPIIQANAAFGKGVLGMLAADPYGSTIAQIGSRLDERQLADLYIWLMRHGEAPGTKDEDAGKMTPRRALALLGRSVLHNLSNRGTTAASAEISRIDQAEPIEGVHRILKSANELVRQNTWQPLSPADFLSTVLDADADPKSRLADNAQTLVDRSSGTEAGPPPSHVFRQRGDQWLLAFAGKAVTVRHLVGFNYIVQLLRSPRKEIEALALVPRSTNGAIGQIVSPGLEVTDEQTIQQVKGVLDQRREELALLADAGSNGARDGNIKEEIQKLESFLRRAKGDGRIRKAGGTTNRARSAVTNAISRAKERIREHHPALAGHLDKTIRTGSVLVYLPDDPPDWEF
jgi:hypothetical protein